MEPSAALWGAISWSHYDAYAVQRETASLVYMANALIEKVVSCRQWFLPPQSGSTFQNPAQLGGFKGNPTILIRVSYALLDLIALPTLQLKALAVRWKQVGMRASPEMIEALHER